MFCMKLIKATYQPTIFNPTPMGDRMDQWVFGSIVSAHAEILFSTKINISKNPNDTGDSSVLLPS